MSELIVNRILIVSIGIIIIIYLKNKIKINYLFKILINIIIIIIIVIIILLLFVSLLMYFWVYFGDSCSQHEAYEAPGKRNGLYAFHLLNHLRRNERIELILMDVARGMLKEELLS